ncbi:MAG: tRNA modification GTPase [Gemmataceae bacterium]|nr:tRNA modification GTPase [Gemmataceae bacterium]
MLAGRGQLPHPDDTMVALASAHGPGARAIVRLSGPRSPAIVHALMPDATPDPSAGRQWCPASLRLPDVASPLPADIYFWPAPKTYTGQDLVEIHTLSSPPLVQLLIAQCLNAGARAAQPGEFTMRAFLAGKLDLTRAEAVLGVVSAGSRGQLKEALTQLAGGLAQPLDAVRDDLLNLLADVEAGLDFADEDIHFVDQTALLNRLAKGLAFITLVRKQMEQRALGHRAFRVVLAGPTNAGKSRLFNVLAGKDRAGSDRAIVSEVPGATRDWLEATIQVEGIAIQVVDTAGRRDATDAVERQAQTSGAEQARHADLILWCRGPEHRESPPPSPLASDLALVPLATKSDLGTPWPGMLAVSAVTGAGLDELRGELARRARDHAGNPLTASLSRCRHHVDACLEHLRLAHHLVLEEQPPELLALEIRLALEELGAMVGAVYTDDLLDRIFSRFCIGK